jgi:DNA gyrase subunit B/topoisomerase-4 subunit B
MLSHVNGIPTPDGGTHEQGLRDAVTKAVRAYAETHNLVPRGLALTAEDVREGLTAILSTYVEEPQFQGQTKGRLNSPEARSALDATVRPALEQWLHHNPSQGQAIVARTVLAGRARIAARDASAAITRRSPTSGRRLNLPGKLSDCQETDSGESELFIVEGDSAGGSAKQARNRKTQAVLPLRGKVLNAEQATLKKVLENEELNNIALALGCGIGPDVRVDRLRYGRIILLMDADSDGHHISTLLLTFFYRYMRALLEEGRIFLAMPPLFRVDIGKATFWALDERDRDRILREHPRARAEITRFKGLGEMPPKMLFETTLDPARRRLMKVDLSDAESAARVMDELMGKDPRTRYDFIMEHAAEARDLDI